jgi:hypothetical protein
MPSAESGWNRHTNSGKKTAAITKGHATAISSACDATHDLHSAPTLPNSDRAAPAVDERESTSTRSASL